MARIWHENRSRDSPSFFSTSRVRRHRQRLSFQNQGDLFLTVAEQEQLSCSASIDPTLDHEAVEAHSGEIDLIKDLNDTMEVQPGEGAAKGRKHQVRKDDHAQSGGPSRGKKIKARKKDPQLELEVCADEIQSESSGSESVTLESDENVMFSCAESEGEYFCL